MTTGNGYDPNTLIPTRTEANRDEHETHRCTWDNPCTACDRR